MGDALLVDGYGGRESLDVIDIGLVHAAEELAGVGREALHVATLPFGVDGVEGEGALPRAGHAGDDHQLVAGNGYVDVLEVVLSRALNDDVLLGHISSCSCVNGKRLADIVPANASLWEGARGGIFLRRCAR